MTTEPDSYFDSSMSLGTAMAQGWSASYSQGHTPTYTSTYIPRAASTLRNLIASSELAENETAQPTVRLSRPLLRRRTSSLQQQAVTNQAIRYWNHGGFWSEQATVGLGPYDNAPSAPAMPTSAPVSAYGIVHTGLPHPHSAPPTHETPSDHDRITNRDDCLDSPHEATREMVYARYRLQDPLAASVPPNTKSYALECVHCGAPAIEYCREHCMSGMPHKKRCGRCDKAGKHCGRHYP